MIYCTSQKWWCSSPQPLTKNIKKSVQSKHKILANRARDHDSRVARSKISFDGQDHVRLGRQCHGAIEFSDPLAETRLLDHHLATRPTLNATILDHGIMSLNPPTMFCSTCYEFAIPLSWFYRPYNTFIAVTCSDAHICSLNDRTYTYPLVN